jgi:hypothetical protein
MLEKKSGKALLLYNTNAATTITSMAISIAHFFIALVLYEVIITEL